MKKIGRYVINSELGRGAMGIVYRASDPTIDREVALKVLSISDAHEEGTNSPQEMFMREVRAAGRLAHPAIVVIYDAFDDHVNQTSCIVMELVPGMTLEKILESGHPLTTEQFLSIIRQVADGLDYAHRNHVIHRDLKPANILVTAEGRAKITDFGIAKVLAREGVARTVGIMGTPSYMSPEQVRGGEVDARTDIFSLGIMIFTMLTGQKPFTGNTAAVMFKIVYEEPALPSSINAHLTSAHDEIIKKCLAKDRSQRYASARELLDDMDDLQQGRPLRSQAGPKAGAHAAPPAAPAAARPGPPPPPAPVPDKTLAMPIPGLMKGASRAPAPPPLRPAPPAAPPPRVPPPPPRPLAPSPGNPLETRGPIPAPSPGNPMESRVPVPAPPSEHTVAMPISGLMKSMSGSPSPRATAAPPPSPPKPVIPPPVRSMPPPDARPLTGQTLPMRAPDFSGASLHSPAPPHTAQAPPAPPDSPFMERTLPTQVPERSAVSPPTPPRAAPVPRPPAAPPRMESTLPMPAPNLSSASPQTPPPTYSPPMAPPPNDSDLLERTIPAPMPDYSAPPPAERYQPAPPPLSFLPDATQMLAPAAMPEAAAPAPKSKLIPVLIGGVAAVFLAGAVLVGYWKFHQIKTAPAPPAQVAVQTPPMVTPPAVPPPEPVPAPAPVPAVVQPATPGSSAPAVTKKPVVRKTKQAMVQQPVAPAPPPQPAPVVVAPPPVPVPAKPSPEELARAEAARLAKIPRIVQVACNFGMKEAMLIFSAGGSPLFEESLKGKKVKGGFLGIKGSYQGTFTHTITVPASMSDVSIRVVSKDGGTDLTKGIKMPPPGGFVPTLAVEVDSEHLSLSWKGTASVQ